MINPANNRAEMKKKYNKWKYKMRNNFTGYN